MNKVILGILLVCSLSGYAQKIPSPEEGIKRIVTFGKNAPQKYGDDDYSQVFFFVLPKSCVKPFYLRVFDPDIGGQEDEIVGTEDTEMTYSFYGGKGCISNPDVRSSDPEGDYKAGDLMFTKTFKGKTEYDGKWFHMGPFNPGEGEYSKDFDGLVFKVVVEGTAGDDGNLYSFELSSNPNAFVPIEGANSFTFEYTFRLPKDKNDIVHIYPFVSDDVVSVRQSNFDWDNDGQIRLYSISSMGFQLKGSGDAERRESVYFIKDEERGKSLDIQFQKKSTGDNKNNVVFSLINQYGQAMPFYTAPIGGIPKFEGRIVITHFSK